MNSVVHFELPADDRERMKAFYTKAFGWEMKQMGAEMGNYVVVQTAEMDEKGMIQRPGAINGGIYQRPKDDENGQHPSVVIAVEDINAATERIKASGGTVIGGMKKDGTPDDIPGIGLYSSFIDTEGNRLSILQPKGM